MTEQTHSPANDERPNQPTEIVVVGVGSEIMGDDGFGPHVIERLQNSEYASNNAVEFVNAGTTGFLALEAMSGANHALVIDAVQTGSPPGTIQEYRCVDGTFVDDVPDMTMHDVSFTEALVYAREVYDLPEEIRILGVEPATIAPSLELSESVEAAIPDVIDIITDVLAKTGAIDDDRAEQTPAKTTTPEVDI